MRGGGLGDDGRVLPEAGARHARPDIAARPLRGGGHERPDEGRVALLGDPRLDVIGGHEAVEAGRLGRLAEPQQLLRRELLEHRGVADDAHQAASP